MDQIESPIFLLGSAALLAQLARVLKVPCPIFLVLGGLSSVPSLPWTGWTGSARRTASERTPPDSEKGMGDYYKNRIQRYEVGIEGPAA